MVRAKFYVTQINLGKGSKTEGDKWVKVNIRTIHLSPVSGNEGENKIFGDATPMGRIEMTIYNPDAFNQFVIDGEYYVDFKKTPEEDKL